MTRSRRFRILWTSLALADLADMEAFIAQDNPRAAAREAARIRASLRRLVQFPSSGSPSKLVPGVRTVIAHPHVVFYEVVGHEVHILRVLHGRRRSPIPH